MKRRYTYWRLLEWFRDLEVWRPTEVAGPRRWWPTCPADRWPGPGRPARWASIWDRPSCARRRASSWAEPFCGSFGRPATTRCWSRPPAPRSAPKNQWPSYRSFSQTICARLMIAFRSQNAAVLPSTTSARLFCLERRGCIRQDVRHRTPPVDGNCCRIDQHLLWLLTRISLSISTVYLNL